MATEVVDVFLRVNIPSASPCCLPAPLRSAVWVRVCVGGRESLPVPALVVFVCICCTYGTNMVQQMQAQTLDQVPLVNQGTEGCEREKGKAHSKGNFFDYYKSEVVRVH